MINAKEKSFFSENGYLHTRQVLDAGHLEEIRRAFDEVWETESPHGKVNQHKLLKYQAFLSLIEHPPILERHRAIFGNQVQLLQYDLLRQGPRQEGGVSWHRDFSFPGDRPLSINTIVYLDDMVPERGPTRVVPGSHRGEALPSADERQASLPGEVAVEAAAGDAVFINSAVWHTGDRNRGDGLRRGIYLYYGYWWLKRYEHDQALPWQAFAGASEERLRLLGVSMPDRDLHIYDPTR